MILKCCWLPAYASGSTGLMNERWQELVAAIANAVHE